MLPDSYPLLSSGICFYLFFNFLICQVLWGFRQKNRYCQWKKKILQSPTEQEVAVMACPDNVLQAIVMHNFSNEKDKVVSTRYELGSLVTLRPDHSERKRGRRLYIGGVL
jgi:hypothetical protein